MVDKEFFGNLIDYIEDENVTDINCNSKSVWINDINKGRYKADIEFTEEDIKALAYRVSNTENAQFNIVNSILSADLGDLRFHFTHNSFSISGTSVSIRKTPVASRINEDDMDYGVVKYLSEKANMLLKGCIQSRLNTVVCGLPGAGKTELVKYLMGSARSDERIITIEDTAELHLQQIYQDRDIVELKVNKYVNFEDALTSCMRMLPVWVLLSEARGKEVKYLLKCVSAGFKIITTLHSDDARQIPIRILNMFEDNELDNVKIETMVYDYVDIGVHVRLETTANGIIRYVDQIVYFEVDAKGNNVCHNIYSVVKDRNGVYNYKFYSLPKSLLDRLEYNGVFMDWEVNCN